MTIGRAIDDIFLAASEFMHGSASAFCRLESAIDETTLTADDGTLLSFIELHGSLQLMGRAEFDMALGILSESISGYLKERGHALQFVMLRDPESAREEIDALIDPMISTASALNVDIKRIMDANAKKLSDYVASEHVFVVVWTYPHALPSKTRSKAKKRRTKAKKIPSSLHSMDTTWLKELQSSHRNFLGSVKGGFDKAKLGSEILSSHCALRWVRKFICPELTSRKWLPQIPVELSQKDMRNLDAGQLRKMPIYREVDDGLPPSTAFNFPSLKRQLFPRAIETTSEFVEIDNKIHRPSTMEAGPQQCVYFSQFYREMLKHKFGWRISFHITGDGLAGTSFKSALAATFAWTNSENRMLLNSIQELKDLKESNASIARFEMNIDTWVDKRDYYSEKDARDDLATQHNSLVAALQSWGSTDVREIVGDPLLPFSASVPGLALSTPSVKPGAPLTDVLGLMPISRPASPWSRGSLVMRTIDGKLYPVAMLSSKQSSWTEIGYGGLGAGKSAWINTTNWSYIFAPGLDELPHLGIIDIGPSSSGLIRLLENSLPKHMRKYVAAHKLVMSRAYAINPFDTPLGCRKPFAGQMSWLVDLLSTMCTGPGEKHAYEGVGGILRLCIEKVYEDCAVKKPKRYQRDIEPDLDEKVHSLNFYVDEHTTWWEIVDQFFKAGMTHEATLAQRYAVPLLYEIGAKTRDDGISNQYSLSTPQDEKMTDYVARKISEALQQFPIFEAPTKFDLGEARIVSLDLNDVAAQGGGSDAQRQTGIMYMLAWQLIAGKYFYTDEDPESIRILHNKQLAYRYAEYHKKTIKKMRSLPKRVVVDEFHRVARITSVVHSFETGIRESRKWLISFGFYSQKVDDMPEAIRDLATTHYVLGADSPEVQKKLVDMYSLNSGGVDALKYLGKPDVRGANCLAIFHVDEGMVQQLLTNTIGALQLWAFSTTREDMDVRDELYRRIGPIETLDLLAKHHPGGVKIYVEQKRERAAKQGVKEDAIAAVVDEILALRAQEAV